MSYKKVKLRELKGVEYCKQDKYSIFHIIDLTEDIKNAIRKQFPIICHGEDYAASGRKMYNYQNTAKEFLNRYEAKTEKIKRGMIGELLIHLLITYYLDEYKAVTPFFNMEERSIKKGYDIVLTETNNPTIWLTEVKSGELHNGKNTNQTMKDLLNTAKNDLKKRLNEENQSLWHEAINGAKIAFDHKNTMKEAVIDVLSDWGEQAYDDENTSSDKNVILSGVVFSNMINKVSQDIPQKMQENIEKEKLFNEVYIISLQKETYERIYDFIKEEVTNGKS